LAAKCTVVYKTHPAHPATNELAYSAIKEALEIHNLPDGVFQITELEDPKSFSTSPTSSSLLHQLVTHPKIQAVGFTGSQKVGKMIMSLAANRPVPIPVYAEMGSVNPLFVFPDALQTNQANLVQGLTASYTMGCGQFCTKPGLVFVIGNNENFEKYLKDFVENSKKVQPMDMLTEGILENYKNGCKDFIGKGIKCEYINDSDPKKAGPAVFRVKLSEFQKNSHLYQTEIFGPATLLVHVEDVKLLSELHELLEGQLTASFHGTEEDLKSEHVVSLISSISTRVGRVIWNGYPTGVEVNHSMVHGGPFPATSDSRSTSVGGRAILRWVRPLCYQAFPESLLPHELQLDNPVDINRLVDGKLQLRPQAFTP